MLLDELESQSIYILREAYSQIEKLAMLWSIGKGFDRAALARAQGLLRARALPARDGSSGKRASAGRWAAKALQCLLISSSSKVSYFVTFTSPPWRKNVTNLNSVRTARAAFLMASLTPGKTLSEAEIFPIGVEGRTGTC